MSGDDLRGDVGPPANGEGEPLTATRPAPDTTRVPAKTPEAVSMVPQDDVPSRSERAMAASALQAHGDRLVVLHGVNPKTGVGCTCSKATACRSVGKHARFDGWEQAEPMSEAEIDEAWPVEGFRGSSNLGVATGHSYFVVDIDPDKGGLESAAGLVEEHGPFPPTRVNQTGSKGYHYAFEVPDDFEVRNSVSKIAPGIDIRGRGGLVVVPPSVTDKGEYRVVSDLPIAPAPAWLLDMLRPKDRPERPGTTPAEVDGEHSAYFASGVEKELARLDAMQTAATPGGVGYRGEDWDGTCHKVACNLQEIANTPGSAVSLDHVREQYLARAPRDEGFGPEQHAEKWASAGRTVAGKTRSAPVSLAAEVASWGLTGDSKPADVPAEVKPPAEGALTDGRMSAEVAGHLRPRFRWCPGLGWLRYDGRRWVSVDDSAVLEAVRRYVVNLHARQARQGKSGADLAPFAALLGATRIANLTKLAKGQLLVEVADLDAHPDLLNVGNGVVDLRTGALRPHDPDLLLTKITPTPYLTDATHGDWDAALTALPDVETREWMQDKLGQGVTGHMASDDTLVIAEGAGSNGKSAVINAILSAAGEHAVVVPDRVLLANVGDHRA
jgi:hypothetical protein